MNQTGNLAFVFVYIVMFILMIFLFVFFAPIAQNFTVHSFNVSYQLIEDSNDTVQGISDTAQKGQIEGILTDQQDNLVFQIDLLGSLNKYAGIIILVISAIALVLLTRSVVQRQGAVT